MTATSLRAARPRTRSRRRTRWFDWLALPAMAVLVIVIGYPIVRAVILSFFDYSLITGDAGSRFVGLKNFAKIGQDSIFWQALGNTAFFVFLSIIGAIIVGLALAFATENLNGPWRFLRAVLLTPWAVPVIVTAFLFQFLFLGRGGVINAILMAIGVVDSPIPWLTSNQLALLTTTISNIWLTAPFFLLVFTAGLRSVPNEVIEAARIDQASRWSIMTLVKLPYLAGPGIIAAVIMIIQNVNQFPLIWAMTQGGPGYSSTTLTIYLYRLVFVSYDVGYGAAIGVVWLVILVVIAGLLLGRKKGPVR